MNEHFKLIFDKIEYYMVTAMYIEGRGGQGFTKKAEIQMSS